MSIVNVNVMWYEVCGVRRAAHNIITRQILVHASRYGDTDIDADAEIQIHLYLQLCDFAN